MMWRLVTPLFVQAATKRGFHTSLPEKTGRDTEVSQSG